MRTCLYKKVQRRTDQPMDSRCQISRLRYTRKNMLQFRGVEIRVNGSLDLCLDCHSSRNSYFFSTVRKVLLLLLPSDAMVLISPNKITLSRRRISIHWKCGKKKSTITFSIRIWKSDVFICTVSDSCMHWGPRGDTRARIIKKGWFVWSASILSHNLDHLQITQGLTWLQSSTKQGIWK